MSVSTELSDYSIINGKRPVMTSGECMEHLRLLISFKSEDLESDLEISRRVYFVYLKLALYQLKNNQFSEAISSLKLAKKADPSIEVDSLIENLETSVPLSKIDTLNNLITAFFNSIIKK